MLAFIFLVATVVFLVLAAIGLLLERWASVLLAVACFVTALWLIPAGQAL